MGLLRLESNAFRFENAPAIFQSATEQLILDIPNMRVYIDDIGWSSDTVEDSLDKFESLLKRCHKANLKIAPEKTKLCYKELVLLGHRVHEGGVSPVEDKIIKIRKSKPPRNPKEVASFLGLVGYYQEYIPDFATKALPLTNLKSKKAIWKWGSEEQTSFDTLVNVLHSDIVLISPQWDQVFRLEVDASDKAMGAVLLQMRDDKWRPIAFASKKLSDTQSRYSASERECLGLIWAVEKFRYYLHGRKFQLVTDHKPLKWLDENKNTRPKLFRWSLILGEYEKEIIYKPGVSHIVPDAMSRLEPWFETAQSNYHFQLLVDVLHGKEVPDYVSRSEKRKVETAVKSHILADGLVYKKTPNGKRVVPPPKTRLKITKYFHGQSHEKGERLAKKVKARFSWPHMDVELSKAILACDTCRNRDPGQAIRKKAFNPPPLPWRAFEHLQLDFTYLPQTKNGHKVLLNIQCYYTKFCELIPFSVPSASATAQSLYFKVFLRYGMPFKIQSDRGSEFLNEVIKEFMQIIKVKHSFSSPYTPTSQGSVERSHRTLTEILMKRLSKHQQENWDLYLEEIQFFLNTSHNTGIGFSPFELLYGFRVRYPLEMSFPEWRAYLPFTEEDRIRLLKERLDHRAKLREQVELLKAITVAEQRKIREHEEYPNPLGLQPGA